ncbi:MAG: DegV family protein [Ruminococcaceae bacterium]|nr:DegV family protein [Oscillospiraceae bacterium]
MNIKIISDSTCDLPKDLLENYNITLFPLTVVKNDTAFKDGVDIFPADIFAHVAAGGALCSTSAGSVGDYADLFEKYAAGYDAVIHISLGSGFSSSFQNACVAASDFDNVYCVDSMNLSTGQGFIVLKAYELAQSGMDAKQIVEELNALTHKVEASFLVDKLDYLVKGGRCSSAAALGANLLNLKPCIEVRDGKMTVVKKYRGNYAKCLANYVKERLADREDIDRDTLFVTKTSVSDECYSAVMNAVETHGHFSTVHETTAGCTISCHCGPGTLGVLFMKK